MSGESHEKAPHGAGLLNGKKARIWRLRAAFWISYRIFRVPVQIDRGYLS